MSETVLLHLSDPHFGGLAELRYIEAVEKLAPELRPAAILVTGDLCQRARAGEFQRARALLRLLAQTAPVHVLVGNHDVQWWWQPLGVPLRGGGRFRKFRRYISPDLGPTLTLDGVIICGVNSSHGLALGSLTWNPRDVTVKGHLPRAELARVGRVFAEAPVGALRVLAVHHNVLKGRLSRRWGLARPREAQRMIVATGADVVCCGHDHEEGIGSVELEGSRVPVSTAGTLSSRARRKRPSSFNLLRFTPATIRVEIHRWDAVAGTFRFTEGRDFAR